MYQFQYEYNFQDMLVLNRVAARCYRRWRMRIFRVSVIALGTLNILMAGLLLWIGGFSSHLILNVFFGAVLLGLGIFYHRLNAWQSRRMMLKDISAFTLTLEEEGMRERSEKAEGFYRWEAFVGVYHTCERYLLFLDKKHAFILPERALTQGDLSGLPSFLEEKTGKTIQELK